MNTLKNKVSLIGRIGAKPEEKVFESGVKKTRISLATNESYKSKNGEWVENTQWHNVIAWGSQADRVIRLLDKGTEVVVEGRLVNRSFVDEKTGEKRFATEIALNDFIVVNKKNDAVSQTSSKK